MTSILMLWIDPCLGTPPRVLSAILGEGFLAVANLESGTVMRANAKAPSVCTEGALQH